MFGYKEYNFQWLLSEKIEKTLKIRKSQNKTFCKWTENETCHNYLKVINIQKCLQKRFSSQERKTSSKKRCL